MFDIFTTYTIFNSDSNEPGKSKIHPVEFEIWHFSIARELNTTGGTKAKKIKKMSKIFLFEITHRKHNLRRILTFCARFR